MDHLDHLALLEGEVAAMAEALRVADLATPIAACPGWTVRDVAEHITGVHRWVLRALTSDTAPSYEPASEDEDLPAAYETAARQMVEALRARTADTPCWTFDRTNRTVSFWRRRQVHEVAVHRFDVAPYTLSEEIAEDGIDEVLDFFLPRQVALGRTVLPPGTLRLEAPGRTWDFGEGRPVTTLTGSRHDLLLWLWGRMPLEGTGDVAAWRAAGLTP